MPVLFAPPGDRLRAQHARAQERPFLAGHVRIEAARARKNGVTLAIRCKRCTTLLEASVIASRHTDVIAAVMRLAQG